MTAAQLGVLAHSAALPAYAAEARGVGAACVAVAVLSLLVVAYLVHRATTTPGDACQGHSGAWALAVIALVAAAVLLVVGLARLLAPEGFALRAVECAVYHVGVCARGGAA